MGKVLVTIGVILFIRLFYWREFRFPTFLFLFVEVESFIDICLAIFQIGSCGIAQANSIFYKSNTYGGNNLHTLCLYVVELLVFSEYYNIYFIVKNR